MLSGVLFLCGRKMRYKWLKQSKNEQKRLDFKSVIISKMAVVTAFQGMLCVK